MTALSTGIDAARACARHYHEDFQSRCPRRALYCASPARVSDLAAQLARAYYAGDPTARHAGEHRAALAGLFAYACEHYGLFFDEVAELTNPEVAKIVVARSSDPRQLPGRRAAQHRNDVGLAGPLSQGLELAILVAGAQKLSALPDAELLAEATRLTTWALDADAMFEHLHHLRDCKGLAGTLRQAREIVAGVPRAVEAARARKKAGQSRTRLHAESLAALVGLELPRPRLLSHAVA